MRTYLSLVCILVLAVTFGSCEVRAEQTHTMTDSELRDLAKHWYHQGRSDAKLEIHKRLKEQYILIKKQKM